MLEEHLGYVSDAVRRERFAAAVSRVVRGGEQVVDLGSGTGILALLCLRAGAAKVYVIDSTAMIEVARQSLTQAGYADKCVFIHAFSTRASLPGKADMVICDQVGYFGFDAGILEYLADATRRFLKPGGFTLPRRIDLLLAPIQSDRCDRTAKGWQSDAIPPEFHWMAQLSVNSKHAVNFLPEEIAGPPTALGSLQLGSDDLQFLEWNTELSVEQPGLVHGLGGWFNCELAAGVWMTNSPLDPARVQRSQVFLPFHEPLKVATGDVLAVTLMARPADNVLSWEARLRGSDQVRSQSTWSGGLIAASELVLRNPVHVPRLNPFGHARNTVLDSCDGVRSIAQIEEAVMDRHGALFSGRASVSKFVAEVLSKDAIQ